MDWTVLGLAILISTIDYVLVGLTGGPIWACLGTSQIVFCVVYWGAKNYSR